MDDRDVAPPEEIRAVFGAPAGSPLVQEPLTHHPIASATIGLWRVRCGDRSAVLKMLAQARGDHEFWRSGEADDHWYYWRREAAAYESGLLNSLAGRLCAPECYLVAERNDGSVAIWLEDLHGPPATTWPLKRYGIAARHLGQAQGEFVSTRPLPTHRWLSRGWLRAYLDQRERDLDLLRDPAAWRHPLVAAWFPDPPVDDLVAMSHGRDRYLRVLDELAPTLSHLDLHPANLFDADGDTPVIDWAFVGIGALGEDAGNLVSDAVLDFHVPPERLDDLYATTADGYHAGLLATGWDGSAEQVRLAMSATMAAKYAWIAPAILRTTCDGRDHMNGRPITEALAAWAPTVRFLLARAHETTDLTGDRS